MTPKRAVWETVVTVCIPSLLFWGLAAYLLRAKVGFDAWPIYLILALLPFPLCIPLYRRYRKGPQPQKPHSRFYHLSWAILGFAISIGFSMSLLRHHGKGELWYPLLMTIAWLCFCIDRLLRAAKTTPVPPTSHFV